MDKAPYELYDMHCHLDFSPEGPAVAREAAKLGISAFSTTVEPTRYLQAVERFADCPNVRVGLGFHPWWVKADEVSGLSSQLALFEELAPDARCIGEVGLDFSARSPAPESVQTAVFRRILQAADAPSAAGPKLLSIHAIRSASAVLDCLDALGTLKRHQAIFHWFSCSSGELSRAVKAGCFFSVGPLMLRSRRGREYARSIPLKRLLLETDEPAEGDASWSATDWQAALMQALRTIAELRGMEAAALGETIAKTSARLLMQ